MNLRIVKPLILIHILFTIISCDDDTYSKSRMYKMATAVDPNLELILKDGIENALASSPCKEYGEGCKTSLTVKTRGLELIFVEYETKKQAKKDAKRINQFYFKNWVMDDVLGEPELEKFVKEAFNAKMANPQLKKTN